MLMLSGISLQDNEFTLKSLDLNKTGFHNSVPIKKTCSQDLET